MYIPMLGVTAGGGGARAPVPTPPAESAPVGQMLKSWNLSISVFFLAF